MCSSPSQLLFAMATDTTTNASHVNDRNNVFVYLKKVTELTKKTYNINGKNAKIQSANSWCMTKIVYSFLCF